MDIKEIFGKAENGTLTYEQFEAMAKEGGAKFADLSEGKYVSKSKYDTDLKGRDDQIGTLNSTIATRDADLAAIQKQLEGAGADSTKLKNVQSELSTLQTKYDSDMKSYQEQLSKKSYEFAVKEFAGKQQFTSPAAKRDFVSTMISKNLQLEGDTIIGATDFLSAYRAENEASFVTEPPKGDPEPPKTPHFVGSTTGGSSQPNEPVFNFGFTGVRPHEK